MSPAARRPSRAAPPGAGEADLIARLPCACGVFDADGRLVQGNGPFFELFGEPADLATVLRDCRPPLEPAALAAAAGSLPARRGDRSLILAWRRGPGAGRAGGWVLSVTDISAELDELRHESRQAEQLMFTSRLMSVGEMSATLAHELNQPLSAIVNYLNGSLRMLAQSGPAPVHTAVEAAREQALHAAGVVARVREFVKAREPRRSEQPIADIAERVVRLLALEADRYRVRLGLAIAPDLPAVWGDRVMLEQVLLNLVKNAMEALADAPERRVEVAARLTLDGEVEVRVSDTGPGVDSETQAVLFTAFGSTKAEGLGIGLSICRSIIEYHGGRLFHEPRAGGGSVFGFTVPVAGDGGAR
ncbi:MAG: sensor histidine kinase [Lysobacteraceae bacterium]